MDAMSALKHAHRSVISGSTRTCRSRTRLSARSHLRSQSYSSLETGKTRVSPRLETRNLLRSTSNLFSSLDERVFGAKNLWKDRINTAADRLSSSHPPRIAVWGPNTSDSRNVVTALLDDPLSSDDSQRKLWLSRHEGVSDGDLVVRYADHTTTAQEDHLMVNSPWLRLAGAEVVEVSDPSLDRILDVLLSADIILLATSSLSLLQPPMLRQVLSSLRYHRNVHLVVDDVYASSIPACSARYLQKLQSQIRKEIVALFPDGDSARGPTIHFASTDLAIEANTNFRGSTVQPLHTAAPTLDLRVTTDQFQAAYLASGISNLSSSLLRVLSSTNQENGPPAISIDSALSLASSALMSARNECQRSSAEVVELRSRCSSLRERIDDVDAASKHRIFGDGQEVRDDIITARSKIQGWFDSTTWWRLPWKVDDIEGELRPIIGAVYCRDLERKLVYQTGVLAALQTDLTSSTWKSITFPHTSVFSSPVLRNSLEQLVHSTTLSPTALTTPISARLNQLLGPSGALAYLHLRAQRLLLQSYAISFGSAGSMWAAWATNYVDQGAALGLGALGVVGGARWAVGKWEKARCRWWEDWDRVGEGLERDIKAAVDNTVQSKVGKLPLAACDGLEAVALRQTNLTREVSWNLRKLEDEVRRLSGSK